MSKVAPQDTEKEPGAERALTDLVRLLAQQAAREVFAEAGHVSTPLVSHPTEMESDNDKIT